MHQKKTLQQLRKERDMTREQLAVAANTTYPMIVRLDQRKQSPRVDIALRIARALGVAVEDIDWEPVGKPAAVAA